MRWPRRLIALFLVGVLGLYPLLAPPPHRIDKAHCDLIKEGMTKDEVESIFGAPPGEYDFAETKSLYISFGSVPYTRLCDGSASRSPMPRNARPSTSST